MNAYDHPEATARMMERIEQTAPRIMELKRRIANTATTNHDRIRAFTECYMLMEGDPHAQKRLVLELETGATHRAVHHSEF